MKCVSLAGLFLLCISSAYASEIDSVSLKICNTGHATFYVATSYYNSGLVPLIENYWRLHGWSKVDSGQCPIVIGQQSDDHPAALVAFAILDAAGVLRPYRGSVPKPTKVFKNTNDAFCAPPKVERFDVNVNVNSKDDVRSMQSCGPKGAVFPASVRFEGKGGHSSVAAYPTTIYDGTYTLEWDIDAPGTSKVVPLNDPAPETSEGTVVAQGMAAAVVGGIVVAAALAPESKTYTTSTRRNPAPVAIPQTTCSSSDMWDGPSGQHNAPSCVHSTRQLTGSSQRVLQLLSDISRVSKCKFVLNADGSQIIATYPLEGSTFWNVTFNVADLELDRSSSIFDDNNQRRVSISCKLGARCSYWTQFSSSGNIVQDRTSFTSLTLPAPDESASQHIIADLKELLVLER